MKKIILILLFLPVFANAQFVNQTVRKETSTTRIYTFPGLDTLAKSSDLANKVSTSYPIQSYNSRNYAGGTAHFFGNSITAGAYVTAPQRWTTLFSGYAGLTEVNYGINGSTMIYATPYNPLGGVAMATRTGIIPTKSTSDKLLVYSYGVNDVGYNGVNYTASAFKSTYETVILASIAKGWNPEDILIISPGWITSTGISVYATATSTPVGSDARLQSFISASRDVAFKYGTKYINMYNVQKLNGDSTQLINDGIHPNASGHLIMAKGVYKYLNGVTPDETLAVTSKSSILAQNSTQWNGVTLDAANVYSSGFDYIFARTTGSADARFIDANGLATYLTNRWLPLTGGTLTGALSGTSASFSGNISGNNITASGNTPLTATGFGVISNRSSAASGLTVSWQISSVGSRDLNLVGSSNLGTPGFGVNIYAYNNSLWKRGLSYLNVSSGLPSLVLQQDGGNTIVGTATDDGINALQINGYTKATGYRTPSGTSSQYLMADGSVSTGGGVQFGTTPQTGDIYINGSYIAQQTAGSYPYSQQSRLAFTNFASATNYAQLSSAGITFQRGSFQTTLSLNTPTTNNTLLLPNENGALMATSGQTSGTGSLTLDYSVRHYVFTGTTSTWTLPAISGGAWDEFYIKNRGSGTLTINTNGGANVIYNTSASNTISLAPGDAIILVNDGTFFNVE